ncbi:LysR family transcriptional regulator [Pseudomonas qingdaonensis]|nr:LysR family transcriptional regulator [Pseudomonas qingdaonensis]
MKHLLVLQAIQAHGSLTQVALRLSTSQPAITQILADLESLFSAPFLYAHRAACCPLNWAT